MKAAVFAITYLSLVISGLAQAPAPTSLPILPVLPTPTPTVPTIAPAPAGACLTVYETAVAANLTTLVAALDRDGLATTTSDPELAYTVFAPTDAAFEDALDQLNLTAAELFDSVDLNDILQYHLLAYPMTIEELLEAKTVHTQFDYQPLTVEGEMIDGDMMSKIMAYASDASVILPNVTACKSYVHVIDAVLLPDLVGTLASS